MRMCSGPSGIILNTRMCRKHQSNVISEMVEGEEKQDVVMQCCFRAVHHVHQGKAWPVFRG
jgi:hypothetical protein